MLIGALSAGVPPVPSLNVPDTDRLSCDDRMVEFHMQATVELVRTVVRNGLLRTILFCR